jgi:hypothetical protein
MVRIGCLGAVADPEERALAKLVVLEPLHVRRRDAELDARGCPHQAARVVRVGEHLAIGVRHLLEAAPGVVEVARGPDLGGVAAGALGLARDGLGLLDEVTERVVRPRLRAARVADLDDATDEVAGLAEERGAAVLVGDVVVGELGMMAADEAREVVVVGDRL